MPKLMQNSKSSDPEQLLNLLPSMAAVCFDMTGEHHRPSRPSQPLGKYYQSLNSGLNSPHTKDYTGDSYGPWDDILCWFPSATD
mmetsp:Transcript_25372/g.37470  ORF Transcript_25372/g.37470 Transcript_25372/m.37470 type:complete len:84 (-) Transcript_25372:368-619(-)